MPSRKEIQWSQLKVGVLVLVAMAVLIALIFLMSGSTGGLFAEKIVLRSYFPNAANLKQGAPVTLEGVTVGNVTHIRVVPSREPSPVEVVMKVGAEFKDGLHTDSTTSITQAGVLGDSYVDISSENAKGPAPANNAELKAAGTPSIQDVIGTSQSSIQDVDKLVHKLETLIDTLNSRHGTIGEFINDPELYKRLLRITDDFHTIASSIADGKGSLGKLVKDETVYNHLNSAVEHLDQITAELDKGNGSMGKLLHDDALYNNLNATVRSTHELVVGINEGRGALGKLAKDPDFAKKLDDTVSHLDELLRDIDEGKGTLGQLAVNRTLYDHTDQTMEQARDFLKGFRENPKKYLTINMKIF
ncbi:MAG TPA: MlaD family protein [Terracidiphilus sp.]|nr:MlaD family protein [Terracidiphilus sp.]